jgi:hypothetical protein
VLHHTASDKALLKRSANAEAFVNGASLKLFKQYLGDLQNKETVHFWTGGQWSMHELVAYLVSITGPANLFFTTWAINEDAMRMLMQLHDQGLLLNIRAFFDHKIKEQKSKAFLLAEGLFTRTALGKCHAKCTVLMNEHFTISITGSQNWTRNPRAERGTITMDKAICESDIDMIMKMINEEQPFKVR